MEHMHAVLKKSDQASVACLPTNKPVLGILRKLSYDLDGHVRVYESIVKYLYLILLLQKHSVFVSLIHSAASCAWLFYPTYIKQGLLNREEFVFWQNQIDVSFQVKSPARNSGDDSSISH